VKIENKYQVIESYMLSQLLAYNNNRPVKCSELGHLYNPDDFNIIKIQKNP